MCDTGLQLNRDNLTRRLLALAILLSGLAMLPFVDLPPAIGWQQLAGVYQPRLEVQTAGGPAGTVFTFSGANYPPNRLASIYVDGRLSGTVETDDNGQATFILNTGGIAAGAYNVTLEVDTNASATATITLLPAATPATPPTATPEPVLTATAAATAAGEVAAAPTAAVPEDPAPGEGQAAGRPAERAFGAALVIAGGLLLAAVLVWAVARRLRN